MNKIWRWFVLSFVPILLPLVTLALELDETRFMPVDQIRPGMVGVGRTVFSGTEIEEFQVEILGVLKNMRPKGDVILARVSGGPLDKTGVIQGMSGSPVYIEGKLIGAMAFAWGFSIEPISGITPIEEMLQLWQHMENDDGSGAREFGVPGYREMEGLFLGQTMLGDNDRKAAPWAPVAGVAGLTPMKTPVMLSGFDQRVVAQMAPVLEQFHLVPIQAGTAADEDWDISLQPGASVAAQMVRGDASLAAVGTLTYRDGDRFLAFGHPMFSSGEVDLPLAGAYVHSVLPSQMISFKLASAGKPIGVLRQDRRPGVAGLIGQQSTMIPFRLNIRHEGGQAEDPFFFEMIDNRFMTPNLVVWSTVNAFLTSGRAMGESTMELNGRIAIHGYPDLKISNIFSGSAPHGVLATSFGEVIAYLLRNNLEKVSLKEISLDVTVADGRRVARIAGARLDKKTARPGEQVQVTIFLEPYRGEERTLKVAIQVPDDSPEGRLTLQVSDAASSLSWEQKRAPNRFQFANLSQVFEMVSKLERNDQLIIKLVTARGGAVIKGQELPSLPPSMLTALRGSQQSGEGGLTHEEVLVEKRVTTEYVLSGQMALPLRVER
ncbi:SpoIVB peptidase S55 domain-containing protein [Candidatus Zixiibacteriota bacterium]